MTQPKPKTKRPRKRRADHVVPGNDSFRCLHCGDEQPMSLPMSIDVFVAASKAYTNLHRRCEQTERGLARFKYTTVEGWRESWDTGVSSLTIYAVFAGTPLVCADVPHDPADFARCYRLLQVAPPAWRADLHRVADRYPAWRPFVERWADLERLYEKEREFDTAPELYALLQEIKEAP